MDTTTIPTEASVRIAELNDAFRQNPVGYMYTVGIMALDPVLLCDIVTRIQDFNKFTEENDPYGEHDFGSFEIRGHKIFWKIDYYDEWLKHGTEPLDPKCRRILTVMLAEEY